MAAIEITMSCLPGGALNPPKKALNPLLATIGGVLGPAVFYLVLNLSFGEAALRNGWGIPTATDIAIAWLDARVIFGKDHPAVTYLLLLAIADDAIGLFIIAVFYPTPGAAVQPTWLGLVLGGMVIAYLFRRWNLRNYWPYILLGGGMSWAGLIKAHLHPALALVSIVPFLPHPAEDCKDVFEEDLDDHSTLSTFEHEWKVIVDLGLFAFGLANAGVAFSSIGTETWLVFYSLLFGKILGIAGLGYVAAKWGFPLPEGMSIRDLFVVSVIGGIGFTVALFIAGEAFVDPVLQDEARMGALLSILFAFVAIGIGRFLWTQRMHESY
jgi:NhaA family Na+:H+ antiporter